MTRSQELLCELIRTHVLNTPDICRPEFRGRRPSSGLCYVASEAYYHLVGGKESGLVPKTVRHEGSVHWWLEVRATGERFDLTADQFKKPVPYEKGRGRGFLTARPSERARVVMTRVLAGTRLALDKDGLVVRRTWS